MRRSPRNGRCSVRTGHNRTNPQFLSGAEIRQYARHTVPPSQLASVVKISVLPKVSASRRSVFCAAEAAHLAAARSAGRLGVRFLNFSHGRLGLKRRCASGISGRPAVARLCAFRRRRRAQASPCRSPTGAAIATAGNPWAGAVRCRLMSQLGEPRRPQMCRHRCASWQAWQAPMPLPAK